MGGGINGHLGLVLYAKDYEEVSLVTPHDKKLMTTPLRITTNMTTPKNKCLQEDFKEKYQLYREKVNVEKSMTNKIVAVIEKKYLQAIEN